MRQVVLALLLLHAVRLAFTPTFELVPQEAYYFLYAQHPALSYFDHPPAIAWLITPFAALLGKTALAPRLACWLATLGTGLAFAALARRTLPRGRRPWALLAMGTTLLATIVSLIATPDVPLLLFWALSLLHMHRAAFGVRKADWLLAGLFMGLAFDSKYTGIFLQLGLLLFLMASPRHRRWLATPWPYLALLVAHAVMAPVYVWNAEHGFASFLFQSQGRAQELRPFGFSFFGKLLATQSFLVVPPLFCAVVWALARSNRLLARSPRRRSREQLLFLTCFALPLMALFATVSFVYPVKPNWLEPAWLAGTLLAVRLVRAPLFWKVNLGFALTLLLVTGVEVALYPVPIKSDDTWFGWKELAAQVQLRAAQTKADFVFSNDQYKTSAELRFYSPLPVYAGNLLGLPAQQFDYLGEDPAALVGKDGLFVDSQLFDNTPTRAVNLPEVLAPHCRAVDELDPILLRRRGEIVRKFFVFRCQGYSGTGRSP